MSLLLALVSVLPGALSGILLTALLWRQEESRLSTALVKLAVGVPLGIGLNSILYFWYLLAFAGRHFFLLVQLCVLGVLLVLILRLRITLLPKLPQREPSLGKPWQAVVVLSAVVVAGLVIAGLARTWALDPYGGWDAFMIFNRTARFVFRAQSDWQRAFSPDIWDGAHADYPLLVPLSVAQAWDTLGRESLAVPRLLALSFTVSCTIALAAALTRLRSLPQAAVALLVLLTLPAFLQDSLSQTADLPLACLMLCTIVLLSLHAVDLHPGLLLLAGLTTGLAAWTKNEGILFSLAMSVALCLVWLPRRGLDRLAQFAAGLALPLATVIYFKLSLAPPNDLVGGPASALIMRLAEWPRHLAILNALARQLVGSGRVLLSLPLLLTLWAVVFGLSPRSDTRTATRAALIALALQAAGYYVIYLATPHSIDWQLYSSLPRLLMHLYVPLIFVFFASATDIPYALGLAARPAEAEASA